jgi:DNA-binding NarL/FixJ family response regulator
VAGGRLTSRVLIVDDDARSRAALRELLAEHGLDVAGEAASGEDAIALVDVLGPDVVLMDLEMPGCGGIEATRRIAAIGSAPPVLLLCASTEEGDVVRAIAAGACGYVVKDASPGELSAAVRDAVSGDVFVAPSVTMPLLRRILAKESLTAREVDVLRCLSRGLETNAIAAELALQPQTVKNIVGQILRKLGVRNRVEAAVYAVRMGL